MDNIINVLKALSDETRLRIINLLYEQELCVCELVEVLQMSQPKTSRHLSYLKNSGLVSDRKHLQWVYYSLTKDNSLKFLDQLVLNDLRGMELYKNDIIKLKELRKCTESCDFY